MAYCRNRELILKSIGELRAKRKRPDNDSVTSYAEKHYGLSHEDCRESLSCLLNDGTIVNKPTHAGLISLFISEGNYGEEDEGVENNSFLEFLDNVKTPEKNADHRAFTTPGTLASCSSLNIIEKLVDNNTHLHQLLNDERQLNKQLQSRVTNLQIELQQLKTRCARAQEVTVCLEGSTIEKKPDKESPTSDVSAEQKLKQQWKEIQIKKHQEYTDLKATKERAIIKSQKDEAPTTNSREVKRQKGIQNSNTYTNNYSHSNYYNNNNDNIQLSNNNNKNWRPYGRKRRSFKKPRSNANGRINRDTDPDSDTPNSQNGILLLGDSHVRRLNETKLLGKSIKATGVGGLRSDQVISKHRGTINNELPETNKVIIHIGSNDVAKGVYPKKIASNVESAGKKLQQINPKVEVTTSAIFHQGNDLALNNLNVSKTNLLLRELCYHQGWSFLDNGNINFNHLDQRGMHLTKEGNHLFAKNVNDHVIYG